MFIAAKYLEEDYVSRRQNYGKTAFVTLDKIPTWVEQSKEVPMPNDKKADLQPNTTLNSKISLWQGDITVLEIDALVNAANSRLAGGGGGKCKANIFKSMLMHNIFRSCNIDDVHRAYI